MRNALYRLVVGAALFAPLLVFGQKNSCLECHGQLEDELKAPVIAFKGDIHGQFNLSCVDCHGGNSAEDDLDRAKDRTFKGAPKRTQIPQFCGGCHADGAYMRKFNPALRVDQLDQFWTSRHGQLIKAGDSKAAVCTDCHGIHGIQTARFPKSMTFPWNIPQTCGRCHADAEFMKGYKIATDQVEEYRQSIHAHALLVKKDLSAPACNDCHGNHGAFPPEVSSVASVCRQCHPSAGELFARSPHKKAFDEMGVGECEACHGNHKIDMPSTAMIGVSGAAVCGQCHEQGSRGFAAATEIRGTLNGFEGAFREVEGLLALAERKGVEVSDAKVRLLDVTTALVGVKNLTHGLDVAEIRMMVAEGETALSEVRAAGEKALREARFRRQGLVVATVCLAFLAVALILKVRQMAGARKSG